MSERLDWTIGYGPTYGPVDPGRESYETARARHRWMRPWSATGDVARSIWRDRERQLHEMDEASDG